MRRGTLEQRLATGISYNPQLVVIDLASGRHTLVRRSSSSEEFGEPIMWSPDDTQIAYRLVRYETDPHVEHPGPGGSSETPCMLDVSSKDVTCHPELTNVVAFDWAPDGRRIIVDRSGAHPLQILDVATGNVSPLVSPRDLVLDRALRSNRLGRARYLFSPVWSDSGEFVAAWVFTDRTTVPAIFDERGRTVALGRPSGGNALQLAWFADRDLLAYSPGYDLAMPARWVLRGLDPDTARDDVRVRQPSRPFTIEFLMDPTSSTVALVTSSSTIHLVDLEGDAPPRMVHWSSEVSLVDWAPVTT